MCKSCLGSGWLIAVGCLLGIPVTSGQTVIPGERDIIGSKHVSGDGVLPASAGRAPVYPGDCDNDGDVDLDDWVSVHMLLTGPIIHPEGNPSCGDFDADSDVDLADVTDFATGFTYFVQRSDGARDRSDLNLTALSDGAGSITVAPGTAVTYEVVAELSDDANEGLAFLGFDLEFDGGPLSPADAPADLPMLRFAIPDGVTNPAGYGGTLQDGKLLQVGGGQNTIMNGQGACIDHADCPTGSTCAGSVCTPVTSFPVGLVMTGVAQPGVPAVVASGSLTAPTTAGAYTLQVTNAFATVIKQGETGVPFWATEAVGSGTVSNLTINVVELPVVRYVDADATGADNGLSWCDAYLHLQDALAEAQSTGAITEIRVANGTYKPDEGVGQTLGDRLATFQLLTGVAVYGGYAGCGAPDPDERDIVAFETILSGDLNGDDAPDFANYVENSCHVVTGSNTDAPTLLDGVTVTGGNSDGTDGYSRGGGLYSSDAGATVSNCRFDRNLAQDGGAVFNEHGGPVLSGCTFSHNSAGNDGGAVYNALTDATVTGCSFSGNLAGRFGGAVLNVGPGEVSYTDCTFTGNSAEDRGGGMYNGVNSPTLTNCTFQGNSAEFGAGMYNDRSWGILTNCAFTENSAVRGGAVCNEAGEVTFDNCTINANLAAYGAGMHNYMSSPTLNGCTFSDNMADPPGFGGGMCNHSDSNPTMTDCTFSGNWAYNHGGGIWNAGAHSTLVNCTLRENSAFFGGAMLNDYSDVTMVNCTLTGNSAIGGGGVACGAGSLTLLGCKFCGNFTEAGAGLPHGEGGAAEILQASALLVNCAFSGNTTDGYGGALYAEQGSNVTLSNCSFGANVAPYGPAIAGDSGEHTASSIDIGNCVMWNGGDELWHREDSSITATYSNIQGGWPGAGNIDQVPLFMDPDGIDNVTGTEDDDLHLRAGSPCIDAGANNRVPPDTLDLDNDGDYDEPTPLDLDGAARFFDDPTVDPDPGEGTPPIVDLGAYEYQGDCNDNGVVDSLDIAEGTSEDCTGNGVPDECEADCNDNGVADSCDIADETSADCNANGIPDECEADTDGDGVIDDCDNCPEMSNPDQVDQDGDGVGNACDPCPSDNPDDPDGDGVCTIDDNCPVDPNPDQEDEDEDGLGNPCDPCPHHPENDADHDGVCFPDDQCPNDPNKLAPGLCGCGVAETGDSDGDGVPDCNDLCPGVDDTIFAPECADAIPTVSTWGLIVLTLLLLTAGKVWFSQRIFGRRA